MTSRVAQLRIAARLRRTLAARARLDAGGQDAAASWRAERLTALRQHAVRRSPLYRRLHQGLERAPLSELPTVTKADLVERFDEVVTDPRLRLEHLRSVVEGSRGRRLALGRYRVASSSGSSGRPGLLAFDEREWTGLLANAARARAVAGPPPAPGRVRSAKVGSPSPWHLSRQVSTTLQDPRKPSLSLDAARDVGELAGELAAWRPDVLTAYPSVLASLAHEQLAGRLDIAPVQVFSGGERLTPATRARVRAAWAVEPFDQYVTTEAGFVAIECPAHDGLHVLDDHVAVEVVDADGSPVPAGTYGDRVLVTVLGSRTLPLIRYELGDSAALAEGPCACGRHGPRLQGIAGGARDLLHLPAVGGGTVAVHPVAFTAVLDVAPVQAWQVVQERDRLRVLLLRPEPGWEPERVSGALVASLSSAGAAAPHVAVEVVDTLPRSGSGKAALVVRASMPA